MPDLHHTLLKYDLGHLKVIAELWGLEIETHEVDSAAEELSASLLDPEAARETIEILPAEARSALNFLAEAGGKMEWGLFSRTFGEIREMGAGKRDREAPHLKPTCPAEILFYRSLLAKAFFDSDTGAQEYAYIPDDLMPLVNQEKQNKNYEVFGRLATRAEKSLEQAANDNIVDDATTLLAALRLNLESDGLPPQLRDGSPALHELLSAAKLIKKNVPQTEAVKSFLASSRAEALDLLYKAWLDSQSFDELRLIRGLICEGEWSTSPRETRQIILNFLDPLPGAKWWSLPAFLSDLKVKHPDFQRPAGDYDSWFIKRASDGQYLRGFAHWDEVDGAVVKAIVKMLHWLGRLELATAEENAAITAFRFATFVQKEKESQKLVISSNGNIKVPRLFSRAIRYQIARFCEWQDEKPDEYRYLVSARSLKRANEHGLKAGQFLSLLVKHTNSNVAPALVKALKSWEANGTEARVESLSVLRVIRPEIIVEMRKSKAGKFLGELLSPTAVVVKEGATSKVLAALAELGLLAEVV